MLVGKVAEKEVVEDRSRLENDRLVEEKLLVSALECPVCLTLPHSAPVYTCRVSRAKSGCDVSVVFVKKKLFAKLCAVPTANVSLPAQVGHSVCGRCWKSLLKQRCPVCLTEYNRSAGLAKLSMHGSQTLYISLLYDR